MRKLVIILLSLTLLLLTGYAGYRGYKVWKQSRMMNLARDFIAKKDGRNAMLSLQQVLKANPLHVDASRMMAELQEAAGSPATLLWRSRVVELSPRSTEDRLVLAQTALMLRDFRVATNALNGVEAADRKTFRYQNLAGSVAFAAGQPAEADKYYREAIRMDPANLVGQLNIAVLHLQSTNDLDVAEARISLQRISQNATNANLRLEALRQLTASALRAKENSNALALAKQLVSQTNSAFSDKLLQLEVLRQSDNSGFKTAMHAVQAQASTNLADISALGTWQMTRIPPAENLAWLRSLPKSIRTNQPAAILVAECLTNAKDWTGLHDTLAPQSWGELDFLRHAFLTKSLREQNLSGAAKGEWELALKTANSRKASLEMLLRLAAQWKWTAEAEELLWAIVNRYPEERWAFTALTQALYSAGRTRPLMQLCSLGVKRSPSDIDIKNNLAMTALLLEASELKPHEIARENYQKAPTNASTASTYAFSLLLQSKNAEALKIMKSLSPRDLEQPSVAGYYGLILKATGDKNGALAYLNWAFKAPMLPEERKLFEQARAGI